MTHLRILGLVVAFGCSSGFQRSHYTVEFPSAQLAARRPDGQPWHTTAQDRSSEVLGGLAALAFGSPTAWLGLGAALSSPGGEPTAPQPYVQIKIGSETYRVAATGPTYAPTWKQPIDIDATKRDGNEQVIVQVLDAMDNSVIAQHETTLAALVASPNQALTKLGSVMSLDVRVRLSKPRVRAQHAVTVPSTIVLADLAAKGAPNWKPIPVWNGDTVTITASGAVCPSKPTPCFGPDGAEPGHWASYSYEAFHDVPHASLVAIAPGLNVAVGHSRSFRVEQSGWVLLFVNDTDVGNNEGSFQARIVVTPAE